MLATRAISPGELVFQERAVAVGPFHDTPPVCLACLKRVSGAFLCPRCDVPMCSEACSEAAEHREAECAVLAGQEGEGRVRVGEFRGNNPFYQCTIV
jgi:hypothetical protein